jgi:hypothetical protein
MTIFLRLRAGVLKMDIPRTKFSDAPAHHVGNSGAI